MKKLLLVSHRGYMDGGAMLAFCDVILELKKKYIITVLVPCRGNFTDWLESNEIEYRVLSSHPCVVDKSISIRGKVKFLINGILDYWTIFLHKKEFAEFDLIYTNTRATLVGCYLSKLLNIPHILHCREMISLGNNWITLPWTENTLNKYTNSVLVISKAMLNNTKDIEKKRMKLVYDGVAYNGEEDGISNFEHKTSYNILIAGSVTPAKNQIDIVRAVGVLKKKNIPVKLLIAGQISNAYKSYYKQLQKQMQIDKIQADVTFLGVVSEMKEIRKKVEIEVMCSKFEAFGRVTVEALRSGKLFIGADSGATCEIVDKGKTGFVYPVGDYIRLAEIIELCIKNGSMSNQICRNAYRILKNKFINEDMFEGIEKAIDQEL